jgi:hypothetical protein
LIQINDLSRQNVPTVSTCERDLMQLILDFEQKSALASCSRAESGKVKVSQKN